MIRLPQKSSLVAQTAAILRERIQSGEWHKWLPGEHDLCSQLHVARMTLRLALDQLTRAGLVRSSQGKRREIVVPPGRDVTPSVSSRVLLLTPVPLHFLLPFDVFWANELRSALEKAGYHLEIHADRAPYGRGWTTSLDRLIEQFRPVGCVLTKSNQRMQRWFSKQRLPCVIVGSRHSGVELPSVDKAYRAVCRHAVGLFLARGHHRLALFNPEPGAAGDLESEEGFHEGVARTRRTDVQATVLRHDGTISGICNQLSALFRRREPPTALLVSRCVYVLTAMGHLMRCGLKLPQDVALISRDYEPFLENVVPTVAHYVVSPETMAYRISSAVLEMVQCGLVSPANCQIMPEFREGETLGPRPPKAHVSKRTGSGSANHAATEPREK
jgi:LacI family transcriptional regulator